MAITSGAQIIDAWAQPVLKEGFIPEVVRLFQQSGSAHLLGQNLSAAQLVEMMDNAGVDRVMLCAWHRPGTWVISNDTIAQFVRQFPQRFVGVAAVNLEKPVEAVRELKRAVTELGFKALRVVPWLWNRPPNDKLYFPLYATCIELDIAFCTQVGHTGPLMPSETGRPVPYLDEVALPEDVWPGQSALWNQFSATILGELCPAGSGDEFARGDPVKVFGGKRSSSLSTRLNQIANPTMTLVYLEW